MKPILKIYAEIATSNLAQKIIEKTWIEVIGKNQKHRSAMLNMPKLESKNRKVTF